MTLRHLGGSPRKDAAGDQPLTARPPDAVISVLPAERASARAAS